MPKKRKKTGLYLKAGLIKSFLNQCRLKLVTLGKFPLFFWPEIAYYISMLIGGQYGNT